MECEDCKAGLEDVEPDICGHQGTLFWCPEHKRYECKKCLDADTKGSTDGER